MSKLEKACAPAHSFCMIPRKFTIWLQSVERWLAGGGGYLARDAAEALLDELLEAPARAVAREHGEVVQVEVCVLVGVGDLVVIDLRRASSSP